MHIIYITELIDHLQKINIKSRLRCTVVQNKQLRCSLSEKENLWLCMRTYSLSDLMQRRQFVKSCLGLRDTRKSQVTNKINYNHSKTADREMCGNKTNHRGSHVSTRIVVRLNWLYMHCPLINTLLLHTLG